MSFARTRPACISPGAEYFYISQGLVVKALAEKFKVALLPTVPTQAQKAELDQILANEELWAAGKKEEWFAAELKRIFAVT